MSMSASMREAEDAEIIEDSHELATELTREDLADSDIEVLFDIVTRAKESYDRVPQPLDSALLTAYDEIFAERGWTVEHDRNGALLAFLQLMEGGQRRGEDLLQRFQRVLREMYVDVEINEEGEGVDVTTPFRKATRDALAEERRRAEEGARLERKKHGSFESFFDGSADKIGGTTETGQMRDRERRGSDGAPTNTNTDIGRWWSGRTRSDTAAVLAPQNQLPIRTRSTGHDERYATPAQPRRGHRRNDSSSSRASLRIRRVGQPRAGQPSNRDVESESTGQTSEFDFANSNIQIPGVNSPIPTEPYQPRQYVPEPFRPSDTHLFDEAETFEQQRLHSLARSCIQIWRHRTQEQIANNEEMERKALAFDRRHLLRSGLGPWRFEALTTRNDRETERFFGKLETRAEKARNLFLLTKSFTHWAKSAEDEVQRTSVARRHILRTRFFNGWREITAVNELKIQHFVLGKFLNKWRRRTAEVQSRLENADNMYDFKLAQKFMQMWYFKFCEHAAPAWHGDCVRKRTLRKWNEIVTIIRNREQLTTEHYNGQLCRRMLDVWREKTTAVQALEPQSEDFRRRIMLANALSALQRQKQFAPLLTQFRAKTDMRCVRSAFQQWRRSAQVSRQARNVDRQRLLRNAWTAWNDHLRIKALEERINDRVVVEAMYRWTLASRVSLFQRVHNRNLKESAFLTWVARTNERHNTLDRAERRFARFKRTQLLRTCLRKIEAATAERKAEEAAIKAQYDQKLKQRIFDKLLVKSEHFQELNKWAHAGRFYGLATRTLKTWNEATQLARRNRRRDTYAQMRRKVKLNLVRKTFGIWKEKTDVIVEIKQQATDIARDRTLQLVATLLAHMRERAADLHAQEAEARQQYDDKLKARYFDKWTERMTTLQTEDSKAVAFRQVNTDIAAQTALKKLGWRLWNVQRQEETAIALHQRNFEKHQRAMVRFWLEQAIERRTARSASPTPTRRRRDNEAQERERQQYADESHFAGQDDESSTNVEEDESPFTAGEDTQRLEAWTAFDEKALGLSNLDLSLAYTPDRNQNQTLPPVHLPPSSILRLPPPSSARRPPLSSSMRRFPPSRPLTFPQPTRSAMRPSRPIAPQPSAPPPIPEDLAFDDTSAFWTSTPMPPTAGKPGYLKTPSKRSVARSKRLDFPAESPEKRSPEKGGILDRGVLERGAGVMSAPPVRGKGDGGLDLGLAGVRSFERRLAESGFGGKGGGGGDGDGGGRGRRGVGRNRVGFGDVSHFG
ncbi:Sfi1-domain-containing protein [Massarina eburnea CBS 473.64]|uniref:Sfi1-domain-containing protein n=1 Tax=Massarina eburnea CBS 473.64 TaxID=1395130 RepID=A0A6A6RKS1_9PLEO|nr:Sfi1-domain-containing protein [Massarina eburnea CBS 473.64]